MYLEFYDLAESPFSVTSNPRFLYNSRGFAAAWTGLVHAVEQREGVVVLTGEGGVGKSMLCRALVEKLGAGTYLSAIANPRIAGEEFRSQVLADFEVRDVSEVPSGAHAIVLIDEAQHLSLAAVEQLRGLIDLDSDAPKRIQVLLVGPPELRARLQQPLLRGLRQRVACWAALSPLEADEVAPYIAWRLGVAQGDKRGARVEFAPAAIIAIAAATHGNPRLVNVVADHALAIGHERGTHSIDRSIARTAVARAGIETSPPFRLPSSRWMATAVLVAATGAIVLWWPRGGRPRVEQPAAAIRDQPPPAAATRVAEPPGAPLPPDGTLVAGDSLLVSIAAVKDADRATVVARELSADGLPAFVRIDAAGNLSGVLVGPYVSREEAADAQRQIAALGYPDTRITVEAH